MSSKSKLYTMAMMGAMLSSMAQTSQREYSEKEHEPNKEPKKPIIPNEKNAIKKFEKWSNENNS